VTQRSPPTEPRVLRKGELEFRASLSELEVQVWDYHAEPVHLSAQDLDELGLIATEQRGTLPPSHVAPWREALREGSGRNHPCPSLSDEASARALHLGGLALLPVAEGLDVYVISYDSAPARLGLHHLARLGLRYRGA
jgi:hypothetical protein